MLSRLALLIYAILLQLVLQVLPQSDCRMGSIEAGVDTTSASSMINECDASAATVESVTSTIRSLSSMVAATSSRSVGSLAAVSTMTVTTDSTALPSMIVSNSSSRDGRALAVHLQHWGSAVVSRRQLRRHQ